MFKHRDNTKNAVGSIDPEGTGHTMYARPAGAHAEPMATSNAPAGGGSAPANLAELFANIASANAAGAGGGAAGAAGKTRKRGRDIRGMEKFSSVVFSDSGFPRLHAMVQRSPALMYPPADARAVWEARRQERDRRRRARTEAAAAPLPPAEPPRDGLDDFFSIMGGEQRAAERAAAAAAATSGAEASPSAAPAPAPAPQAPLPAPYHHTQLDTFLRILYEFNHLTFMKLPLQDTIALLARCGRAAVAHVLEYESRLRLERERRRQACRDTGAATAALGRRAAQVDAAGQALALQEAERRQREIDDMGVDAFVSAMQQQQPSGAEAPLAGGGGGVSQSAAEDADEAEWLAMLKENFEAEQAALSQQRRQQEAETAAAPGAGDGPGATHSDADARHVHFAGADHTVVTEAEAHATEIQEIAHAETTPPRDDTAHDDTRPHEDASAAEAADDDPTSGAPDAVAEEIEGRYT